MRRPRKAPLRRPRNPFSPQRTRFKGAAPGAEVFMEQGADGFAETQVGPEGPKLVQDNPERIAVCTQIQAASTTS